MTQPNYKLLLLGLLARIHRDGGHYTMLHGVEKSVKDADLKVAVMNAVSEIGVFSAFFPSAGGTTTFDTRGFHTPSTTLRRFDPDEFDDE